MKNYRVHPTHWLISTQPATLRDPSRARRPEDAAVHALQAPDEQAVAPLPGLLVVEHGFGQPRRRTTEAAEVPERHNLEDVGAEEVLR